MSEVKTCCITGFQEDGDLQLYKDQLQKLGCLFSQKLSQTVNILVTNATFTQKFKVAQLNKNPIPCVGKKWITDSYDKKSLQPLNKYLITQKQMFLGTTVAVCGFTPSQVQKIQAIIQERQGHIITKYKAVEIIRNYHEILQTPDLILASEDEIQRAKFAKLPSLSQDIIPPLVGIEWLEDSLKRKRCKFPEDYAVNLIKRKQLLVNQNKLRTKLNIFLQNDIMDKSGDFLQNTMIHIDKQCISDLLKLFKNLISVCGGYWTDKFSSIVTHVLVTQIDQQKYQDYKKYGTRIHVLRPQWLIDSIYLYNKLPEEDYQVRCFKINDQTKKTLIREQIMRNNQNSQNFNSLPGLMERIGSNNSNTQMLQFPTTALKKKNSSPKTDIFKGRDFYFIPELKTESFYNDLLKTIINAGGKIYDKINSRFSVYVPLKDSPNNIEIASKMLMAKYKFMMVSYRWINECIKKNNFIEPDIKHHFQFRAFDFCVPLNDFHKFIFEIVGYDSLTTLRLRQLLPVLGSTKTNPNKSQISHILCGPGFQSIESKAKIMKIYKQNKKVQMIHSDWLFACLNEKKTLNCSNYLVNEIQACMPQTPEKKLEQILSNSSDNKTCIPEAKTEQKTSP